MAEQKVIHLPAHIAPNVFRFIDNEDFELIKKLAINQAKSELGDDDTLQELGFTGKPDLLNLKVEYPITLEIQEDGSAECHIPINVPCLNDTD